MLGSLQGNTGSDDIHDLVLKYRNYDGEFPEKIEKKRKPKFRYQLKHNGSEALQSYEKKSLSKQRNDSFFGLSEAYLNQDVVSQDYVVIFIEDGTNPKSAKAFRYNLLEKLTSYRETHSVKKRHNSVSFENPSNQDRTFQVILEECSHHFSGKQFGCMYTTDGKRITDFAQLASYVGYPQKTDTREKIIFLAERDSDFVGFPEESSLQMQASRDNLCRQHYAQMAREFTGK